MRLLVCYYFKDNIWQSALPTDSFHRKLSCQDFSKISLIINYFMLADVLWTCNENDIVLPTRNTFKVERSA